MQPGINRRGVVKSAGATAAGVAALGTKTRKASAQDTEDAGEELWSFEASRNVTASPTIVDGTVYIGDEGGIVYALDADDGSEIWRKDTEIRSLRTFTVVDGTVYVAGGLGVLALDAETGDKIWEGPGGGSSDVISVVDGTLYMTNRFGGVLALDATDGEEIWSYQPGIQPDTSIAVDGVVYVGSRAGEIHAVDASTGERIWDREIGETEEARAQVSAVAGGYVYGTAVDPVTRTGNITALNDSNGDVEWRYDGSTPSAIPSTVGYGAIYERTINGEVIAIDAKEGPGTLSGEIWRSEATRGTESTATLADGKVYYGSRDGNLYVRDASDGEELWSFQTGDSISSSPTVHDGVVYFGSEDDHVYAVDAGDVGSSEGSGALHGVLGHHDDLRAGETVGAGERPDGTESLHGFGVTAAAFALLLVLGKSVR